MLPVTLSAPDLPAGDPLAPLLTLPGVAEAVAQARTAVDGLLGHRVLRRRSAEVTAESALRGARASALLEGAGIELERLRGQLLAGGTVTLARRQDGEPDDRGARLVEGAVRLHADLGQVLPAWRRSPAQALARMHVVVAGDLGLEADVLGRPRAVGQPVEDPLGLGDAPDPLEVSARLDGLSRVVLATKAPAVVVSAVVHGELLALRAFGSVDGLVARAAARLVLVDRGLDPKAVSAPEVGHVELHGAYEQAARGFSRGTRRGRRLDRALRAGRRPRSPGGQGGLRGHPAGGAAGLRPRPARARNDGTAPSLREDAVAMRSRPGYQSVHYLVPRGHLS